MAASVSDAKNVADAALPQVATPSVRLESYQTETDFVVNLLVKNLKQEEVTVDFSEGGFRVQAKLPDGTNYEKIIDCARKINPESCSFRVMSTKIEIRLRKREAEIWSALEFEDDFIKAPFKICYPSSNAKKHDWDKIEYEIKNQEEADPDDDINNLFAKIYNSGDENAKRAMIKSMQESNGTVLSTNWEDVGKKQVEVSPPDGMEFKPWRK